MKDKKIANKKRLIVLIMLIFVVAIYNLYSASLCFYENKYEKQDIEKVIKKEKITQEEYMLIFSQTGISPGAAKKLIGNKDFKLLKNMNDLYFQKPEIKNEYIAFPVTAFETNISHEVPFVDIKKGDILITFNTHTLGWRHGHCAIVVDEKAGILLEHMAIGETSCYTNINSWDVFPAFVVLRYPDEKIANKAVEYAKNNLLDIEYNMLTGAIKKDKTDEKKPSSQCAHIVWQAYKAAGVDIDDSFDPFVVPKDIAMSKKLKVVQIYGINSSKYKERLLH